MLHPEMLESLQRIRVMIFLTRLESEIAHAGECNSRKREKPARQHPGRGAFHSHPPPPRAQKEQREITGGGNRKRLADHEVDVELLDLHAEQNRHSSYNDCRDSKCFQSLRRS